MNCIFFGHRDSPEGIYEDLKNAIRILITSENVSVFYMGNNGSFDQLALSVLQELKITYPHIRCQVVLAYLPHGTNNNESAFDTIFPAEVATAPARFAIDRRNDWLIRQSNTVVTYVTHSFGGAAKFKKKALVNQKRIIELSAQTSPPFS